MQIAVMGGGLQGVEICMLAKKAAWNVILFDRSSSAPAADLADRFIQFDIETLSKKIDLQIKEILSNADIVIPALECDSALNVLTEYCELNNIPLAFDKTAYAVSSSKVNSQKFFEQCASPIPSPAVNKECIEYPLIAKPSKGSGSKGVKLLRSERELYSYLPLGLESRDWIIESFCPGRQFSMEICGTPGNYSVFQLTELLMDDVFDCRAVLAPAGEKELEFTVAAEIRKLAENLNLHGIMDIEVVKTENGFKVLEIDARFPSQTPLTVFHSTGLNLLEHFVASFIEYQPKMKKRNEPVRHAEYFHMACKNGEIFFSGEYSLSQSGPLRILTSVPGTCEVLIGGFLEKKEWSAVLFFCAESREQLEKDKSIALDYITNIA